MLQLLYGLVIMACLIPTLPGLLGVITVAFGYLPALNLHQFGLNGFEQVLHWQGIGHAIGLTLFSTLVSGFVAAFLCFLILQSTWGQNFWPKVEKGLPPMLAMPHVAFAIGFAFLFDPTGLLARILHAVIGNDLYQQASSKPVWLVKDAHALGLTTMLAIKEVPFLLLMSIPLLRQLNLNQQLKIGASLGYQPTHIWWKVILPQWLRKMRLPFMAVIAYGVSVVDVTLILGPTNPPTLAVLVWQWFNDPDLTLLPRAAAGAMMLFLIAALLIWLMRATEWLLTQQWRGWQYGGRFGLAGPGRMLCLAIMALFCLILPVLLLWSVALRWRFPDWLPSQFTARFWHFEWANLLSPLENSVSLAMVSASLALLFAVIAQEARLRFRWSIPSFIIAMPMLLPQLSLLMGLQVMTLLIEGNYYWFWVCWAHVFFAFPFVYLSLDGPWRSFDNDLIRVALSLGKSPRQAWFTIKLPILSSAVVFAWAVGVSVSLAQYLPTLMLGAGRIGTITTEAVAISSGFDRRVMAIYALWQALLPLLFFSFALFLSHRLNQRHHLTKGFMSNVSSSRQPHHL